MNKTVTVLGKTLALTQERIKRIESTISEQEKALAKEQDFTLDLQNTEAISNLKTSIAKLKTMLG